MRMDGLGEQPEYRDLHEVEPARRGLAGTGNGILRNGRTNEKLEVQSVEGCTPTHM